ncbi:MFS transporter [Saccharopolyspora sp. WRP15-2]|uniref:MFS transporter n=1 Tax=Saccharopolyspora oryzae TaxID=2997343 RepID=A0ABT4UQU2_9PSEU|nr:MFS transporter [Saccharopolyspora oryzae]MDA3624086.1 MFS transporter [Saccharopolyspora oryzae]
MSPRPALVLLRDRRFGTFFFGKTLSLAGLWSHNVIAAVLAYQLTGSVLYVGLVSVVQFGPQLLFVGASGVAADRGDRRLQIILGRLVCTAGSAALGVWCLLDGSDGPVGRVMILAASLVMGMGLVLGGPALLAIVPALVREAEIPTAVRLDSLPMLVGRSTGPALGALLIAWSGPGAALFVAAATNVLFSAVVAVLRVDEPEERDPEADNSMRVAVQYVRRERRMGLILLGIVTIGVAADPALTLAPAIAEAAGGDTATVGIFASAFGIGAALGVVVMGPLERWFGRSQLVAGGLCVLGAATAVLALSPPIAVLVGAFAFAGAGMSVALTSLTTLLQVAVPDSLRGRVMSLWLACFVGSRPIAALLNGALADVFSVPVALVIAAALVAVTAWACRPAKMRGSQREC